MLRLSSFLRIGLAKLCKHSNFNFFGVTSPLEHSSLFLFNGLGDSEDERILGEFLPSSESNKSLSPVTDLCESKLLPFPIPLPLENFWIDLDDTGESKLGEEGSLPESLMGEFWPLLLWKLTVLSATSHSLDNSPISSSSSSKSPSKNIGVGQIFLEKLIHLFF